MKKLLLLALISLISFNTQAEEKPMITNQNTQLATFAGGCFWCLEPVFDNIPGVTGTIVGYSGGDEKDADYESVSSGRTGHKEAIQIEYDPSKVTFEALLEKFMRNIDPTDDEGQFADKGPQYRTSVYYHNNEQKQAAEKFFNQLKGSKTLEGEIHTEIEPYKNFFPAEEYHQEYYQKNSIRYNMYKYGSGRPSTLKKIWGSEGE